MIRRVITLLVLGSQALLAACADSTAPALPAAPPVGAPGETPSATAPSSGTLALALQCVADVGARSVRCRPPADTTTQGAGPLRGIVIGGQGVYVQLTSSGANYDPDAQQFTMDVAVQNLIPQVLGTTDGSTPDADGVRVFFHVPPVATAGTGAITVANPDGVDTFTASNQPFYRYAGAELGGDGVLAPNETSGEKPWQFSVPNTVTAFTFGVYVEAEVRFPNGYVEVTPAADTLLAGDTVTATSAVRTALGVPLPGETVTYTTSAAGVATVDAAGIVTAVGPGVATITATAGVRSGAATVAVCPSLDVGETYVTTGADAAAACFGGGATTQEFTVIPFNTATNAVSLSVTASGSVGVTGPPTPDVAPFVPAADRSLALGGVGGGAPVGRQLAQLAADFGADDGTPARTAPRMVWGSTGGERLTAGPSAADITPGVPAIGDLYSINTAAGCNDPPSYRTGRVRSVSARAVVVSDTANPAGGFTTAQYDSISLEFDSIAYKVVTENFGEPSDLDANSRVVLFYTRAVNELSPPASSAISFGYFLARDVRDSLSCPQGNRGELIHALVPDPTGAVNSNVRAVSLVRGNTMRMLTHELQHLVNASRRLAVLGLGTLEDTWLDEGMSDIAEELAFYRTSVGLAPRQNIVVTNITTGPSASRRVAAFNTYANPHFTDLRAALQRPDTIGIGKYSAVAPSLANTPASRGLTWAFLRYAADRRGGTESDFWKALVDGPATGRAKLAAELGNVDLDVWQHEFHTAMYADDAVAGVAAKYTNPSWSYRSMFVALNGSYQLLPRPLNNGVALTLSYAAKATSYLRFAAPANGFASLTMLSGGSPPPSTVRLLVMRTK